MSNYEGCSLYTLNKRQQGHPENMTWSSTNTLRAPSRGLCEEQSQHTKLKPAG